MEQLRTIPLLLMLVVLCCSSCAPRPASTTITTVYVVRHAEKLNADADTPLSPAGEHRAVALAERLSDAGVQRIYATNFQRTQRTVAQVAERNGLEVEQVDAGAVEALVARIKTEDLGKVVLVAGHSNTVPAIVQALSGMAVEPMPEERFDRLFKVKLVAGGAATVDEMRYGAPTP
jgi:broad specificity phosphatase PhoE